MNDDRILILARVELQRTDWKLLRAMERFFAGAEWCDWRDEIRKIASNPDAYAEPLPPEPPFSVAEANREAEVASLKSRILELEDANATLKDALADAEDQIPEQFDEDDAHKFPAPHEKLTDWDAEAALTTDDLIAESDEVASDVISKLTRDRRRRFTELLNVELAELQQNRDGPKEDRKREAKIERLLGIFARAGEM